MILTRRFTPLIGLLLSRGDSRSLLLLPWSEWWRSWWRCRWETSPLARRGDPRLRSHGTRRRTLLIWQGRDVLGPIAVRREATWVVAILVVVPLMFVFYVPV